MASITDVSGIGPATARLLAEHNIHTAEELASMRPALLMEVPGFNDNRARSVIQAAANRLKETATAPASSDTGEATAKKKAAKKKALKNNAAGGEPDAKADEGKSKNKKKKGKTKKDKGKDGKKDKKDKKNKKKKKDKDKRKKKDKK